MRLKWFKRKFSEFRTCVNLIFNKLLPGSSSGSKFRNFLSYLYLFLGIFLIVTIFVNPDKNSGFKILSIAACLMAFLYFYAVIITAIFLISDKFQIKPIRLIRDVMISAFYTICSFALHFQQFGLNGPVNENPYWFDNLYFSAVTFSTLGYGDFAPKEASRPFAALEALYGNIHLGLLAGSIFLMIEQFSKQNR